MEQVVVGLGYAERGCYFGGCMREEFEKRWEVRGRYSIAGVAFSCGFDGGVVGGSSGGGVSIEVWAVHQSDEFVGRVFN